MLRVALKQVRFQPVTKCI